MSSEPTDDGASSEAPEFYRTTRMPLDAVVRLHFEGTVAYQNGFAANVIADVLNESRLVPKGWGDATVE